MIVTNTIQDNISYPCIVFIINQKHRYLKSINNRFYMKNLHFVYEWLWNIVSLTNCIQLISYLRNIGPFISLILPFMILLWKYVSYLNLSHYHSANDILRQMDIKYKSYHYVFSFPPFFIQSHIKSINNMDRG